MGIPTLQGQPGAVLENPPSGDIFPSFPGEAELKLSCLQGPGAAQAELAGSSGFAWSPWGGPAWDLPTSEQSRGGRKV